MITQAQGMFVFLVGIVITLLGVGGVESSVTAAELMTAVLVAVTGLGCVACGAHMINRAAE
jgi:multisubunit Na+/H+ antiporter MnhG subunit